MKKTRIMFFMLLSVFGLMASLATSPAFAVEKTKSTAVKVDVNNATEQELEALPGVGPVYAKKIIEGRPYRSSKGLVKAGIPQSTVDKLKGTIHFGKVKKTKRADKKAAKKTTKKTESKETKTTKKTDRDEDTKAPRTPARKTETKEVETKRTESRSATKAPVEPRDVPAIPPRKGMVWVNKDTMIYHKEGDRWYGNTKNGEFMNESDAIKTGARISKQD